MNRMIELGDDRFVECQREECAWWVYYLGERGCAIAALAQLARVAYENQGK